MSRKKVAIWFAKGFTARCHRAIWQPSEKELTNHPGIGNLPPQIDQSQEKRQAYMEGWEWANGLMRANLEPYTEEEVDSLAARWWRKSRQIA